MSLRESHRAQRGLISQNTYLETDIHSVQEHTTGPAVKTMLKISQLLSAINLAFGKQHPLH